MPLAKSSMTISHSGITVEFSASKPEGLVRSISKTAMTLDMDFFSF
jgi:hypothetical protein